jgi:Ni,Fe-hydrogenase maturation factor
MTMDRPPMPPPRDRTLTEDAGLRVRTAADQPAPATDEARAPVAPLLVLAVGNPSRGDDALGPRLLDALHAAGADLDGQVELLGDFQLQIEHVLDLRGRRAVLFVDAARPARPDAYDSYGGHDGRDALVGGDRGDGAACPGPEPCPSGLTLQRLRPAATLPVLSHALEPAAVLHVAARLGEPMPPAWLLAIEGERFDLGADLSAVARTRLQQAVAQAGQWITGQLERQARPHA